MNLELAEELERCLRNYPRTEANGETWVMLREQQLTSILAHLRAEPWQPIESAPRDGAWILVCAAGEADSATIVKWHVISWRSGEMGWYIDDQNDYEYVQSFDAPTHWQPLPTTPKES